MDAVELLRERSSVGNENSLMSQLVDGLVLLYNMSAHKQLTKVRP